MCDSDDIAGMTVNERLGHFKLFEAFDAAVDSRDVAAIIAVLLRAKFTDAQARRTASAVLSNPGAYGFRPRPGT
jgi:hypothetical protein